MAKKKKKKKKKYCSILWALARGCDPLDVILVFSFRSNSFSDWVYDSQN